MLENLQLMFRDHLTKLNLLTFFSPGHL